MRKLLISAIICLFVAGVAREGFSQSPATLSTTVLERGIAETGNTARLQQLMAKARRGETITLGFIGGSQTVGGREPGGFCQLVGQWFKSKFPSCTVNFVFAGVSATGSDYGAYRIERNILRHNPDFVMLEWAVNDWGNSPYNECYEACIRRSLAYATHPAVMLLFLTFENGNSAQYIEEPIGTVYNLPMVSFGDAILPECAAGRINWGDCTVSDRLHLSPLGHSYTGQLICHLLDNIYATLPSDADLPAISTTLPSPKYSASLVQQSAVYYPSGSSAIQVVSNNGWNASASWYDGENSGIGWSASVAGSTLELKVSGPQIGFMYFEVDTGGKVQATIDGGNAVTKDAYLASTWGYSRLVFFPLLADTEHTVRFTLQASSHPGAIFLLEAVTVAGRPAESGPVIVTPPAGQSVPAGQTATFSVTAGGTEPLAYQWQSNFVTIAGASNFTYTTRPTTLSDSGTGVRVIITNSFGSVTSSVATLTVLAPDNTPPVVSLTAPGNGATVSNTVTVSANASDDVAVAGVQFKLDGGNLGAEDTSSPYSISWDTWTAANGSHTLTAVARDAAGNATTSTAVNVTVTNAAGALTVASSSPAAVKGNAVTLTTASFTPPAGSMLYILFASQQAVSGITDNLGTHLTYTLQATYGNSGGGDAMVYLYTAPVTVSQAMTLSVTQAAGQYAMLKVLVITGADHDAPVGAKGGGRGVSGVVSDTYTSTAAGSLGWLLYADWMQQSIPTAGANQSVYDSYTVAGEDTYAIIRQTSVTPTVGASVSMSTTAPTTGAQISHLYFEMRPSVNDPELRITGFGCNAVAGEFILRWQSVSNHRYTVQAATNLLSGFNLNLIANIAATPPENVHTDNVQGVGMKFYRVMEETLGHSLFGWELNSTNTGLAGVGINKDALPLYTGSDTPPYGTVIREKKITTCLVLVNGNITIERCWIQPANTRNQGSLIFTYDPGMWIASQYSSSILDCDIDGTAITDTRVYADAAVRGHATVLRCNIFGMGSGIAIGASPQPASGFDILVEGNYVHDLRGGMFGDPPQQSHNESATIRGYNGTNMIWRNNRLVSKTGLSGGQDSAALFIAAQNAYLNHVRLEGNLMESIGWCIAVEPAPYGYGNDMRAVNNRFVPLGYGAGYVAGGPGWAQWTDNYYNNPANPDNKGAAAAEP